MTFYIYTFLFKAISYKNTPFHLPVEISSQLGIKKKKNPPVEVDHLIVDFHWGFFFFWFLAPTRAAVNHNWFPFPCSSKLGPSRPFRFIRFTAVQFGLLGSFSLF